MTVNLTWVSPISATIDLAAGALVGEINWDAMASGLYVLGGTDGNAKTGKYQIGGTTSFSNANMTQGLTINQGTNDDEILAFKSGDVAHGVTGQTETDTFGFVKKSSAGGGGLLVQGLTEGDGAAVWLKGVSTTEQTAHNTSAGANVQVDAALKLGAGVTAHGAGANLFAVTANGTTKLIVTQAGDIHVDGSATISTFDEHDDLSLVRAFDLEVAKRGVVRSSFDSYVKHNRRDLETIGIVAPDTEEGRGLWNVTRHVQLLNGAVWQVFTKHATLLDRLAALERHTGLLPA